MHDPYRALYIHVPFCRSRCAYCDFDTQAVAEDDPAIEAYTEQVVLDIRNAARQGFLDQIETVYVGGGTPTYPARSLVQILYTLSLFLTLTESIECSVEANPDSLTGPLVRDLWALGANRISIGVQSFDDEVLALLGRAHDAAGARQALACATERFDNVSVDLMCGIPGQTEESLRQSIGQAVELGAKHVSIYPLTIEQETPFYRMCQNGELPVPDPDVQASHMQAAAEVLQGLGFERYEVASYALPGYACRHNTAYWTGVPYLGLGPMAVTMTQNAERRMRKQDECIVDDLDARQMMAEDLMLGMRMSAGLNDELVAKARTLLPKVDAVLERLAEQGLVRRTDTAWVPTERGWLCGNDLYGALFDLAP